MEIILTGLFILPNLAAEEMRMQIVTTIECDPEAELVARVLYAYNSYPGWKPSEIPWPPKLRQQLSHYLKLGEAVIKAQREANA